MDAKRTEHYLANRERERSTRSRYYGAHAEYQRNWMREHTRKLRMVALCTYGGDPPQCACCGEDHLVFLQIDHINGDGAEHRRQIGSTASSELVRWLKKQGYPLGFQVLCANCNHAKHLLGQCPHQDDE